MPAQFVDIVIKELDETESYQRSGGFWEKVFKLSSDPDDRWVEIFYEMWAEVEEFPKRHARIENHQLVTICLPDELEAQMISLAAAVERTNSTYRSHLEAQA